MIQSFYPSFFRQTSSLSPYSLSLLMPNLYSNFNIVLLQVSGINWEKSREKSKTLLNLERSYAGLRGVKKQKFIINEQLRNKEPKNL